MLPAHHFGEGPPLVALHGFTLTGAQFASAAPLLAREIVAPDLPGHGEASNEPTDIDSVVEAVDAIRLSLGASAPVLGYSQGARVALLSAVGLTPAALVLVSGNAGIEDFRKRSARSQADAATADRIRTLGAPQFLNEWTTTGLTDTTHLSDQARDDDAAIRLSNTAEGLASAIEGYGQGSQPSVWDNLPAVACPVLLISGTEDRKYGDIAQRMATLIPMATHLEIAESGHNPLADQPDRTYAAIRSFLDESRATLPA